MGFCFVCQCTSATLAFLSCPVNYNNTIPWLITNTINGINAINVEVKLPLWVFNNQLLGTQTKIGRDDRNIPYKLYKKFPPWFLWRKVPNLHITKMATSAEGGIYNFRIKEGRTVFRIYSSTNLGMEISFQAFLGVGTLSWMMPKIVCFLTWLPTLPNLWALDYLAIRWWSWEGQFCWTKLNGHETGNCLINVCWIDKQHAKMTT